MKNSGREGLKWRKLGQKWRKLGQKWYEVSQEKRGEEDEVIFCDF